MLPVGVLYATQNWGWRSGAVQVSTIQTCWNPMVNLETSMCTEINHIYTARKLSASCFAGPWWTVPRSQWCSLCIMLLQQWNSYFVGYYLLLLGYYLSIIFWIYDTMCHENKLLLIHKLILLQSRSSSIKIWITLLFHFTPDFTTSVQSQQLLLWGIPENWTGGELAVIL